MTQDGTLFGGPITATCNSGDVVVGGGFDIDALSADIVRQNGPSAVDAWTVDITGGNDDTVTVTAICFDT